jgi:hypothetical protein
MGSFNVLCSISQQTITYNDEIVLQFLLPVANSSDGIHYDIFLNILKISGLNEATEYIEEIIKKRTDSLSEKGVRVSNSGAYVDWFPFGPAISGSYDDYGRIEFSQDSDNLERIRLLETLTQIPVDNLFEVAYRTDWYTYGILQNRDSDKIVSIKEDWQLELCKKLSMTFIKKVVYNELRNPDFSADEKGGIMKSAYTKKWKEEALAEFKKSIDLLKPLNNNTNTEFSEIVMYLRLNNGPFRYLSEDLKKIYCLNLAKLTDLDWLWETYNTGYAISSMNLKWDIGNYGSQHDNKSGWMRLRKVLK